MHLVMAQMRSNVKLFGLRLTGHVQNRVGPLVPFIEDLDRVSRRNNNQVDLAPPGLCLDVLHHRQCPVVARANYQPVASPGYFFLGRERRVSEFLTKLPRQLFLALVDFAAVNHHVMLISHAIDPDGTERKFVDSHARNYEPCAGVIPSSGARTST